MHIRNDVNAANSDSNKYNIITYIKYTYHQSLLIIFVYCERKSR